MKLGKEYYIDPYYFYLNESEDGFDLYFSSEATLLEARKNEKNMKIKKEKVDDVKKYFKKISKEKEKKSTDKIKGEIEELVNDDGSMISSRIPIINKRLAPRKSIDQTVAAAVQPYDLFRRSYSFRSYFGESDMSAAFGYEETKDMDGPETYEYFKDELEMEPDEAKDRTEQQGKDPSGKKDKKSKYKNDPDFISRQTIVELQKDKAIKVVEDILVNKKKDTDINKKETSSDELPTLVKKNLKSLIKHAESNGVSKEELIKLIKGE